MRAHRPLFAAVLAVGLVLRVSPAPAATEGTMTRGVHVTLVSRWLDPGETEALITPFMVLYALHDAVVKPMPGGLNTPSLAESWSVSRDRITYEFVLRNGARFHNGDPVTADDVKFSFERYKGSGAKLLKDKVKGVQVVAPNRVRFVLKEPWPDFRPRAYHRRLRASELRLRAARQGPPYIPNAPGSSSSRPARPSGSAPGCGPRSGRRR